MSNKLSSLAKKGLKKGTTKKFPKKKPRFYTNTSKTHIKKPKPRHKTEIQYDFLQYIRLVKRWATVNSELRWIDIELLLYLYPKGVFTKRDFFDFCRVIRMHQDTTFKFFLEDDWIKVWRKATVRDGKTQTALYKVSEKTRILCNKMHRFCVGEDEITTDPRYNKLAQDTGVRMDKYYLNQIKKMNKNKRTQEIK